MDDAHMPDEDAPLPGGAGGAPVIPAPRRRPAQAADPAAALTEDPFAAQPAQMAAPEPLPHDDAPDVEAAPEQAIDTVAEAEPEAETVADAEAGPELEPGVVAVAEPEAETGAEAEPEAEPAEASLEDMVAGLREGEDAEAAGAEAPAEGAEGEAEVAEGDAGEAAEPEPEAASDAGEPVVAEEPQEPRALDRRSAKIPFWVYLGVWLVFAGVQTYLLWPLATEPFVDQPVYGLLVLIATALVCIGLVLGLCVWWFVSAHSEPAERGGLVRAMLMRSAASMTTGALIWWAALLLLDLRRAGMLG